MQYSGPHCFQTVPLVWFTVFFSTTFPALWTFYCENKVSANVIHMGVIFSTITFPNFHV